MTDPVKEAVERSNLAKIALAAWVNVPVDQLPAEKMWIEHPNDLNRQAWDRVIEAAQRPLLDRIAELKGRSESHFTRKAKADAKAQYERARAAEAQVSALQAQVDGLREKIATAWYDGFVEARKHEPWPDMFDWAALTGQDYAVKVSQPPADEAALSQQGGLG